MFCGIWYLSAGNRSFGFYRERSVFALFKHIQQLNDQIGILGVWR